jgi:hypothetical protein
MNHWLCLHTSGLWYKMMWCLSRCYMVGDKVWLIATFVGTGRSESRVPKHNKFMLQMRTKFPNCTAAMVISGHQFAMISQPQGALREYLQAFRVQPDDPFINLCIGTSFWSTVVLLGPMVPTQIFLLYHAWLHLQSRGYPQTILFIGMMAWQVFHSSISLLGFAWVIAIRPSYKGLHFSIITSVSASIVRQAVLDASQLMKLILISLVSALRSCPDQVTSGSILKCLGKNISISLLDHVRGHHCGLK